jgi:hypothetical protein
MRITTSTSPNFPMSLIAAAAVLAAIYTSSPAHARDLVGSPAAMQMQEAGAWQGSKSVHKKNATRKQVKADTMMASTTGDHYVRPDAKRKAEFARRLLFLMLTMR